MSKTLKVRVGEVTFDDEIREYSIIAGDNLEARDLLVLYLKSQRGWSSIKIRDTSETAAGPARVVGLLK